MSQPEWMQKFQQIGQKSQVDSSESEDRFSRFEKKAASSANANVPEWMKKKSERKFEDPASKPPASNSDDDDDEDAAALFAAAGSKPTETEADDNDGDATAGSASPAEPSGSLTAEEQEMVEKYKKMFKMGMPEGAVMQKMSVDEVPKHVQDIVLAPAEAPPKQEEEPQGTAPLTADEKEMVAKYKKMFKMGMPEGAVIQKMSVDDVPQYVQDVVLAPSPAEELSEEKQSDGKPQLTEEEEEMVTKYKRMFKMGMPEGAVIQKMSVDDVPKHVQDVILAPASAEETGTETGEKFEDEVIEEEVVDDSVVEETTASPSMIGKNVETEPITKSTDGEAQVIGNASGAGAPAASSQPNQTRQQDPTIKPPEKPKMSDEEFGEPWVVDKDRLLRDLNSTRFEEVEVERDTGNVHYEEVYIDENGNEVVVTRNRQSFEPFQKPEEEKKEQDKDDEEVLVDENGSTINDEDNKCFDSYDDRQVSPRAAVPAEQDQEGTPSAQVQAKEDEQAEEDEMEEPAEPPYDPDYDVENQIKLLNRGTKKYRSRMAPWVPYIFIFAIIVAVILILFFVILADDDGIDPRSMPTAAPTTREFIPLDPTNTGAIDVAATTALDPVSGNCDFDDSLQPHVIDQCACTGSIDIIADDIRQRYASLLANFVPSVIPGFDEDINSCDASNQALVWLSSGVNNAGEAHAFVRRERYVLAYFFMDQGGVAWSDNRLWLSDLDVCLWDRTTCDPNGRVTRLDVSENSIIGQLSGVISLLENLEIFSAARNSISGSIPGEIFAAPKLRSLDLSSNSFSGEIPSFPNDATLEIINFASNNLSGKIEPTLRNAESLSSLNLAENSFSGTLPTELFGLPLLELYLAPNFLTGPIPEGIGNLSSLFALTVGPNEFTGDIPPSIGDLNNLTRLVIESVPELTGRLPASFGIGLTNLVQFTMTNTDVRGNIPQQFGRMTALEVLDMSRNSLGRALPSELGLMTSLRILRLDNNALTGTLPGQIGNAIDMVELQLHVNQLTGSIPSTIGSMENLEILNLDANFLDGRTPQEVCDLRQERLDEFTVDCPQRVGEALVTGVICNIPSCCTECF